MSKLLLFGTLRRCALWLRDLSVWGSSVASFHARCLGVCLLFCLLPLVLFSGGLQTASEAWAFWERPPATLDHRGFEYAWLSYGDGRLPTGERYKRYRVPVRAGEQLRIQAQSPHFSPVLELRGAVPANGGRRDAGPVVGQEGRGLEYAALHDGEVDLYVRASERGMMGVFRVQVLRTAAGASLSAADEALARDVLRTGHTVEGNFAEGDERLPNGGFVARYRYQGPAGEHVRVRASASGFSPAIQLVGHGLSSGSGEAANGRGEALLDVILPSDGVYMVSVFSERAKQRGPYSVSLTQLTDEDEARETLLQVGHAVVGQLEAGDLNRTHGQFVDRYLLRLKKHEEVAVDLRSEDFDAYLYVVFPDQGGEESDDLSADSTDARVTFRAPAAGEYEIFATSYRRGETGGYQLEVAAAPADSVRGSAPPPQSGAGVDYPEATESQHGVLEASEQRMRDGSYYNAYAFEVRAGQRWTVELRSEDFDTHLELRGNHQLAHSNDDATAGATNSLVSFKARKFEQVTVYVTSHVPEAVGAYELRVYRGAPKEREGAFGVATGGKPDAKTPDAQHGRVFALMIGISKYSNDDVPDLPYCAADAEKIQTALRKTGMLAPESITLIDAGATRAAVFAAFEQLAEVVGPDDVFFMFYSGHGGQVPSDDPAELDGLDETLVLVDAMLTDTELADLVMTVEPRLTIVALDACYSGGFRAELRSRKNQVGIFSSEEDVASLVASEFKAGGYLARIIARALGPEADRHPRDGDVTVDELLQFIRRAWAETGSVPSVDSAMRNAHQHLVIERGFTSSQEVVLTRPPSLR